MANYIIVRGHKNKRFQAFRGLRREQWRNPRMPINLQKGTRGETMREHREPTGKATANSILNTDRGSTCDRKQVSNEAKPARAELGRANAQPYSTFWWQECVFTSGFLHQTKWLSWAWRQGTRKQILGQAWCCAQSPSVKDISSYLVLSAMLWEMSCYFLWELGVPGKLQRDCKWFLRTSERVVKLRVRLMEGKSVESATEEPES